MTRPAPPPRPPSRATPAQTAAALAEVLDETADALDRSSESAWAGVSPQTLAATLRAERDALRETGRLHNSGELRALFLATGEIQDTSIDNGWGRLYLDLASRFDDALAAYTPPAPTTSTSRRRGTPGHWLAAGLVVEFVVWAVSVGGGRAVLGLAAILAGFAVAGIGALSWIFQDGLFTRRPSFRQAVTDPRRLVLWLGPLLASGALLIWGARTLGRILDPNTP